MPLLGLCSTSIGRFNFVLLTSELYRTSEGLLICSSHSFLELSREHYRHMFSIAIARHKTQSVETKAAPTSLVASFLLRVLVDSDRHTRGAAEDHAAWHAVLEVGLAQHRSGTQGCKLAPRACGTQGTT